MSPALPPGSAPLPDPGLMSDPYRLSFPNLMSDSDRVPAFETLSDSGRMPALETPSGSGLLPDSAPLSGFACRLLFRLPFIVQALRILRCRGLVRLPSVFSAGSSVVLPNQNGCPRYRPLPSLPEPLPLPRHCAEMASCFPFHIILPELQSSRKYCHICLIFCHFSGNSAGSPVSLSRQ